MTRDPEPVVVAESALHRTTAAGIASEVAFREAGVRVERTRLDSGDASAWHVHPSRDDYGFVLAGEGRVAYGPDGRRSVDLAPGDFVVVPAGVVHREVSTGTEALVAVSALVGGGSPVVERDGPALREPTAAPRVRAASAAEPASPLRDLTRQTPWTDAPVQQVRGHADGRVASAWHHHGDNDVFGYVIGGEGYVEWVADDVERNPGDDERDTGDGEGDTGDDERDTGDGERDTGDDERDPADMERVLAAAGEFFRVPAGVVHRDVNPTDAEQDYVLWLTGSEPRVVQVDGPG